MPEVEEVRVLTPIGMLGYGIPERHFRAGLAIRPDVITVDSGSTDSGPQKLGLGSMTCAPEAYARDLALLLEGAAEAGVPVHVSSAGGDGSDGHVDALLEIADAAARRLGRRFRAAAIYAEFGKDAVKAGIAAGRVAPCGPVPVLDAREVDAATTIVGQMGAEPFLEAVAGDDLDLIVAGRAYDPAPIAAAGLRHGFDPGLCWHMGKIMECGAQCAEPGGRVIFGVLRADHFELEPANPAERCTTASVAAHTLYEKSHPYLLPGPGGVLDLSGCTYEQVSERRVRVSGSRFVPDARYAVKLEGAKPVGYRAIFVGATRDPIFVAAMDDALARVAQQVREFFPDVPEDSYRLIFHAYGRDGVMGGLEPVRDFAPLELCVIGEVSAPTQALALAICGKARTDLLHLPYPGRLATSGNIASPFTPLEIPLGQACEFNVYHLLQVDSPTAPFPIRRMEIGG